MVQFPADQEKSSIPRRALLMAGLAGALGCVFPRAARAATAALFPTATSNRRFSVLYAGNRIGAHAVLSSSTTGETRINTEIHLLVKVAFFDMFSFSHRSEEIWYGGRLESLNSDTVEDGETLHIEGSATPQGFRVVSKGGPFLASAKTLTSNSLWTPTVLEQETVVDAQHGGIIGVSARKFADEQIMIAGRQIRAAHYKLITPYLAGSVWYDEKDLWVQGEFERNGSKIQYQLDA